MLTRLPSGLAVPPAIAARVLARRFAAAPLRLDEADGRVLLERLAGAGVFGGATYDGLVGLEASTHGHALFTLDARAQLTYRRLGVPFTVIAA